jgi:hypothetical protein
MGEAAMRGIRVLVLAAALALPALVHADVIHLTNGNRLEVEGWRDAGDVIEFMMGGGIIRIAKAEIRKIDGKPTRGDFRMYTSGVSTARGPVDQAAAATQLSDILKQGQALFGQSVLSTSEKASAFRRLAEQWRGVEVPDPLRDAQSRGDAAIQMAVEAFSADDDTAPDVKERIDRAKAELTAVQDDLKKLGPPAGEGQG